MRAFYSFTWSTYSSWHCEEENAAFLDACPNDAPSDCGHAVPGFAPARRLSGITSGTEKASGRSRRFSRAARQLSLGTSEGPSLLEKRGGGAPRRPAICLTEGTPFSTTPAPVADVERLRSVSRLVTERSRNARFHAQNKTPGRWLPSSPFLTGTADRENTSAWKADRGQQRKQTDVSLAALSFLFYSLV